ncbi:hypothetical protein BLA29_009658 [Euroglyphus maynei]|uniref:Uncharacterized protein n=1 Tax=Euroglyphus maynei TaxID=6958 RepID=A0A1Y3BSL4_EURMA|nr:hypothetical protein BLA29_009658 [Euroglyphus maynei]
MKEYIHVLHVIKKMFVQVPKLHSH